MKQMETMEQHDRTHSAVSRRAFLGSAAMTALAMATPASGFAHALGARVATPRRKLLHVAGGHGEQSFLHTYALADGACTRIGTVRTERLSALSLHPTLPILYTASDSGAAQNLPRGTISAYRVEPDTGRLRRIARVSMSLSATGPRNMAVSPDGLYLLVSAFTGGAWNSFALDRNGMPAAVAQARKETGSGPGMHVQRAAHPFATVFVANSNLAIGTDSGSDRISLLRPTRESIALVERLTTPAGSGPSHAALTGGGQSLVVAHALQPALSIYTFHAHRETRLRTRSVLPMRSPASVLFAHPGAPMVYTVRALAENASLFESWHVESDLGLAPAGKEALPYGAAVSLAYENETLWAAVPQGLAQIRLNEAGTRPETTLRISIPGGAHLVALQQFVTPREA